MPGLGLRTDEPEPDLASVVIPVFNERESLARLHAELAAAFAGIGPAEFLFVDDGSRDGSWAEIAQLAAGDPRVRGVRFRRNFGKAAALTAGFARARGAVVLTLDADLQDDPAEIPRFLAALAEGLDVVSGWKRTRHDPWHKVWPSRLFNAVVSRVTGCVLHDHNCGFKAYRRAVLDEVGFLYGERHRFVPVLAHARGFRVGEVVVQHRARRFGHSKYGLSRLFKGFLDLVSVRFVTRYGQRPLHAMGALGVPPLVLGLLGLLVQGLAWALAGRSPGVGLLVASATALVVGVQLVGLGVLAELLTASQIRPRDTYSIAETLGGPEPARRQAAEALHEPRL